MLCCFNKSIDYVSFAAARFMPRFYSLYLQQQMKAVRNGAITLRCSATQALFRLGKRSDHEAKPRSRSQPSGERDLGMWGGGGVKRHTPAGVAPRLANNFPAYRKIQFLTSSGAKVFVTARSRLWTVNGGRCG